MTRKYVKTVVADNDGTQLSFHNWFAPCMLAIVPQLAGVLAVSAEELGAELGRNMVKHRTHETAHPFVGAWFRSKWQGSDAEFVERVSAPFFRAVDDYRQRYLHVYPGVQTVLDQAPCLGVQFHTLSDAPLYATIHKFSHLGWQNKFAGIYAMETKDPEVEDIWNRADFEHSLAYVRKHMAAARSFPRSRIVALPRHAEKPNVAGIELLMKDYNIVAERSLVIGDSLAKDGGIAAKKKIPFILARYGANDLVAPQYLEVMNHLMNPERGKPFNWHPTQEQPPVFASVATYDGILPFLMRGRRRSKTAA